MQDTACLELTQRDVMGREVGGGFIFGKMYLNKSLEFNPLTLDKIQKL